jgi:hypothetical protein
LASPATNGAPIVYEPLACPSWISRCGGRLAACTPIVAVEVPMPPASSVKRAPIVLMPVVANEAAAYGYEAEDRHFVRVFLGKEEPKLTFDDGLEVVKVLMTAYQSAEQGKTLDFPPRGLEKFVPAVARGDWKPTAR